MSQPYLPESSGYVRAALFVRKGITAGGPTGKHAAICALLQLMIAHGAFRPLAIDLY